MKVTYFLTLIALSMNLAPGAAMAVTGNASEKTFRDLSLSDFNEMAEQVAAEMKKCTLKNVIIQTESISNKTAEYLDKGELAKILSQKIQSTSGFSIGKGPKLVAVIQSQSSTQGQHFKATYSLKVQVEDGTCASEARLIKDSAVTTNN